MSSYVDGPKTRFKNLSQILGYQVLIFSNLGLAISNWLTVEMPQDLPVQFTLNNLFFLSNERILFVPCLATDTRFLCSIYS